MQIGQRHFNAHAFVNAAIFLDLEESGSDGHKGLKIQDAHVSFGFDQQTGAACVCALRCKVWTLCRNACHFSHYALRVHAFTLHGICAYLKASRLTLVAVKLLSAHAGHSTHVV